MDADLDRLSADLERLSGAVAAIGGILFSYGFRRTLFQFALSYCSYCASLPPCSFRSALRTAGSPCSRPRRSIPHALGGGHRLKRYRRLDHGPHRRHRL